MKTLLAALVATLAALAVQPVVLLCWALLPPLIQGEEVPWDQFGAMCLLTILFAAPFVLLLGVPLTLLLQWKSRLKWWPVAAAGAIAGAIFAASFGPGSDSGSSFGGSWYGKDVDFIVNGQPTLYGWLSYIQSVAVFALHGLAGATAFFLVWIRRMGVNGLPKPRRLR